MKPIDRIAEVEGIIEEIKARPGADISDVFEAVERVSRMLVYLRDDLDFARLVRINIRGGVAYPGDIPKGVMVMIYDYDGDEKLDFASTDETGEPCNIGIYGPDMERKS